MIGDERSRFTVVWMGVGVGVGVGSGLPEGVLLSTDISQRTREFYGLNVKCLVE